MKLIFYGGTKTVTGANYLIEEGKSKILVDCGLYQGSNFCERLNFKPFPYNPKEIKVVLITHAHIDHIGRLPKLYKDGFRGQIFSTKPTKEFAEYLLLDSEGILGKEAKRKNLAPIYNTEDVQGALSLWKGIDYHQKIKINGLEAEFFDAGHILGSSFIRVSNKEGKKVIFSGDLGNVATPLVKDTESLPEADYVLIESTYGNRIHENLNKRKDMLEDLIEETFKVGGTLMIPAFAMERTQDLLYELNSLVENKRIPKVPIFIDSPLAIKLTEVYKKYSSNSEYFDKEAINLAKSGDLIFNFPGLKFTLKTEQSKKIKNVAPPKVIIAGSGMSQGGRIIHHERLYLPDPKSTILFIGYQAMGSLGRRIFDGNRAIKRGLTSTNFVKIFGKKVQVKCRVAAIGGYSAHADKLKLLSWIKPQRTKLKKVFIVQGEGDQMIPLAQKIKDEFAIEVDIPSMNDEVIL
ncbi:MAG TPA: MBL fold metallo-hydrolase [Candidatus Wolfebacteria bacterium]|nr:MBL fold metallo-hydrolase [Candidatus Wolfebacteria bacterium]